MTIYLSLTFSFSVLKKHDFHFGEYWNLHVIKLRKRNLYKSDDFDQALTVTILREIKFHSPLCKKVQEIILSDYLQNFFERFCV